MCKLLGLYDMADRPKLVIDLNYVISGNKLLSQSRKLNIKTQSGIDFLLQESKINAYLFNKDSYQANSNFINEFLSKCKYML